MNTRELTNGRDRDKGWTQTDEGHWVPSVFDRRRMATTEMTILAEANGGEIHGPVMIQVFHNHSTDVEDFEALIENFNFWMQRNAS